MATSGRMAREWWDRNASSPAETSRRYGGSMILGDPDIAVPAALLGERGRGRIVMALADGRALPASVLASEAGIAASTANEQLAQLLAAGPPPGGEHGRHPHLPAGEPRGA